jgi:SAM-dependent methyltransferase
MSADEPRGIDDEVGAVRARYARRSALLDRYSRSRPEVLMAAQERERAWVRLFAEIGFTDFSRLHVLEVGSGSGGNLLDLLRLGFRPEHLTGIELLAERHAAARACLPQDVRLVCDDASTQAVDAASLDIVIASTVFSSLLDTAFQRHLADAMWSWVKPGGGVLWYDFTVDNPNNADVRGVPMKRVRELFPEAVVRWRRLTLAPPIARAVCRIHPALYTLCNALPLLRTHVLCWLGKPA